jgi:hypothetical protein
MNDSEIPKTVEALAAKCLLLEAKCYALALCFQSLAAKQGISPERAATVLNEQIDLAHQTLLEKVEDMDPATAANLDRRPSSSDLFG